VFKHLATNHLAVSCLTVNDQIINDLHKLVDLPEHAIPARTYT